MKNSFDTVELSPEGAAAAVSFRWVERANLAGYRLGTAHSAAVKRAARRDLGEVLVKVRRDSVASVAETNPWSTSAYVARLRFLRCIFAPSPSKASRGRAEGACFCRRGRRIPAGDWVQHLCRVPLAPAVRGLQEKKTDSEWRGFCGR